MKTVISLLTVAAFAAPALAQMPQMGGPMKHLDVALVGNQLQITIDEGVPTPIMVDHGNSYMGNASVLTGTMYNAQYGWQTQGFWSPPVGSVLWIEQLSATPGLHVYQGGMMMSGSFAPIFGTAGSSPRIEWNGTMLHNWYATSVPGEHSASYMLYFGDQAGNPTTGFEPGFVTIDLIAVPAPGAAGLLALAGVASCRRRRR